MTLEEFKNTYNGQFVERGGSAGAKNQCVDLANAYINEVLGHPVVLWTNAEDFPVKCMDFCDWIPNTPTGVPEKGDIVIWDFAKDDVGHIAIFLSGNARSFTSFDQNWPLGSKCHEQTHTYGKLNDGVIGWLRPHKKESEMIPESKIKGLLFGVDGDVVYHIPDPDTFNKYFGVNSWSYVQDGVEYVHKEKLDVAEKRRVDDLAEATGKINKLSEQCDALRSEKDSITAQCDRKVYAKEQEIIELKDKIGKKDTEILNLRETVNALQNTVTPVIVHEMSEEEKKVLSFWGWVKSLLTRKV